MCICIYQLILLREKDYEPQAQPGQGLNLWQLDFHDRTFQTIWTVFKLPNHHIVNFRSLYITEPTSFLSLAWITSQPHKKENVYLQHTFASRETCVVAVNGKWAEESFMFHRYPEGSVIWNSKGTTCVLYTLEELNKTFREKMTNNTIELRIFKWSFKHFGKAQLCNLFNKWALSSKDIP